MIEQNVDLRVGIEFIEFLIAVEIPLMFQLKVKSHDDGSKRHQIFLFSVGFPIYFGLFAIAILFNIINIFVEIENPSNTINYLLIGQMFLKFSFIFFMITLGILILYYIIPYPKKNLKLIFLCSLGIFVGCILQTFFVSESMGNQLILLTWVYIICQMFIIWHWIHINLQKIQLLFVIYLGGSALLFFGEMTFKTNPFSYLFSILGLIGSAFGVNWIYRFQEIDWHYQLQQILILNRNGELLYTHIFNSVETANPEILSQFLIGIRALIKDLSQSKSDLRMIRQQGNNIHFFSGPTILLMLMVKKEYLIIEEQVQTLLNELESLYHTTILEWDGQNRIVFQPMKRVVERILIPSIRNNVIKNNG